MIDEPFHNTNQIVCDALRKELRALLNQCTEKQQELFGRIFPGGIDGQTEEKLKTAVDLCQRAVRKNRAGR